MSAAPGSPVTAALEELHAGHPDVPTPLLPLVYDELRYLAAHFLRRERRGHTWGPTDLVHEAVARLLAAGGLQRATSRKLLFGMVTQTMWRLLVDHARHRNARKEGGGRQRVPLDEVVDYFAEQDLDVLAVHEALERLAAFAERPSQAFTLRYLFAFSNAEVAQQLGVSVSAVESDLRLARAWLRRQLGGVDP